MASYFSFFISKRRQLWTSAAVWVVGFVLVFFVMAQVALTSIRGVMLEAAEKELAEIVDLRRNALLALDILAAEATAPACSEAFIRQMREVAYRPDGLNEFIHAPDGRIACTTTLGTSRAGVLVPEPDIRDLKPFGASFALNRKLDVLGLGGLVGTIVTRGDFAVVMPPLSVGDGLPPWLAVEIRTFAPDGRSWHRAGTSGLFPVSPADAVPTHGLVRQEIVCDSDFDCILVRCDLGMLAGKAPFVLVGAVLLAALVATALAGLVRLWLGRYWSFEARFRRNMDGESVECVYQPLLRLADNAIIGCEVLARWRDLDGALVTPDRFIPVVEASGLTRAFTRHVADRAFRELSAAVPADRPLQVNVNIFPCDLIAEELIETFSDFLDHPDRFGLVLELVETEKIDLKTAGAEIEKLQSVGIQVYIDDFGTGYFSVENLVHLQVDGVKLDRCFAMAPEGSVMARMLYIVLEMVAAAGRPILVEGVETRACMESLKANPHLAQFAQGYGISRPVAVDGFVRHLAGPFGQENLARAA
ncbi:EAL domain-containing protein [Mongoliimonas terrestris]|uniref:EAL domain-containing protein n=1 Tax=Mongoliimonas terrestris TaxID=1709001 RepID=UPI0009496462|nr:EAL domain-containing protein [Mongoliimonas terrestris]